MAFAVESGTCGASCRLSRPSQRPGFAHSMQLPLLLMEIVANALEGSTTAAALGEDSDAGAVDTHFATSC